MIYKNKVDRGFLTRKKEITSGDFNAENLLHNDREPETPNWWECGNPEISNKKEVIATIRVLRQREKVLFCILFFQTFNIILY